MAKNQYINMKANEFKIHRRSKSINFEKDSNISQTTKYVNKIKEILTQQSTHQYCPQIKTSFQTKILNPKQSNVDKTLFYANKKKSNSSLSNEQPLRIRNTMARRKTQANISSKLFFEKKKAFHQFGANAKEIAEDFFDQWDRMSAQKKQLYNSLRHKFIQKFPSLKVLYKQQCPKDFQSVEAIKLNACSDEEPKVQQQLQSPVNMDASKCRFKTVQLSPQKNSNQASVNELSKAQLNELLFKSTFFFSKTRKRCLANQVPQTLSSPTFEQAVNSPENKRKQKLNFLNYSKNSKKTKRMMAKQKFLKGKSLIKTKNEVLKIQREGSPNYYRLKKCLQNAIETAIKFRMFQLNQQKPREVSPQ